MFLLFLPAHITSESFNLTSFSVLSDPSGLETIEWDDEGEYAGGITFDRVIANEHAVYVRMYVPGVVKVWSIVIMIDNDILQTKYVANIHNYITLSSTSIGDLLYIVIENVTKHMGTSYNDADMFKEITTITINDDSDSRVYGTWTSTIEPDNITVELDCVVVDNSTNVVVAKCDSETTWSESVFNRIPISIDSHAQFGYSTITNLPMFGTAYFPIDGSITQSWNESIRYNVTGSGSSLTIGDGDDKVTIMKLPESFVSHWVDTIHAKAYMGDDRVMLVPPNA